VIVCLGATAAQALLGAKFRVTVQHGEFLESELGPRILATIHPSAILRAPDEEIRHQLEKQFVADLEPVAKSKL
jgi:DNA polymerase